jgi:ABC-type sugar transport system ATPase subunit
MPIRKWRRVCYEDRKRFGLILNQMIVDNMTLAGLKTISGAFLTHRVRETIAATRSMQSLRVKAGSPFTVTETLSGEISKR